MRRFLAALFFAVCTCASAQQQLTGATLVKYLESSDRVEQLKGSNEDFGNTMLLGGYLIGIIHVHRQNNLTVLLLAAASDKGQKIPLEAIKVGMALTPLLRLPDNLTIDQVRAILRRYLNAHPELWHNEGYTLVVNALAEAFPAR